MIDAVGMEAHGAPVVETMQAVIGKLPDRIATKLIEKVGTDRTTVLHAAIGSVRRGGTLSLIGVYSGAATPMPMMDLFDKQIQLRMGQANVRGVDGDLLPLVTDDSDPLGTEDFASHVLPLDDAPRGLRDVPAKQDGAIKSCSTRRLARSPRVGAPYVRLLGGSELRLSGGRAA